MSVKKWITCAFLFFICYLIIAYLDKKTEAFGYGGRGYGGRGRGCRGIGCGGRGYYGRSFNRGYGYPLNIRNVYPVVVDEYYPSYLYPNYWYSFFY